MNPIGLVWWRFKSTAFSSWRFGYATSVDRELTRMGTYNGDTRGGSVVSNDEIEWKPWRG